MYVGSTENLYIRVNKHRTSLLAGEHKNGNLQKAFDEDQQFSLAFVETETKEEAIKIEQKMLDTYMSSDKLLNISPDASLPNKGVLLNDEKKEQLRQRAIEQFSSQEARDNQSKISKQLWSDPEYRKNHSAGMANCDHEQRITRMTETIKEKWKDPIYRSNVEQAQFQRRKPIMIDDVKYSCIEEAALNTNIPKSTIQGRLNSSSAKFADYSYVSKKD